MFSTCSRAGGLLSWEKGLSLPTILCPSHYGCIKTQWLKNSNNPYLHTDSVGQEFGNNSAGGAGPGSLLRLLSENGCGLGHLKSFVPHTSGASLSWALEQMGLLGHLCSSLRSLSNPLSSTVASGLPDFFLVGSGSEGMYPKRKPGRS